MKHRTTILAVAQGVHSEPRRAFIIPLTCLILVGWTAYELIKKKIAL